MKSSGKCYGVFILLSGSIWLVVVIRILLIGGPSAKLNTASLSASKLVHSSAVVLGTADEQNERPAESVSFEKLNNAFVEPIRHPWKNSISISESRFHEGRDKKGKLDSVKLAMAPALVEVTDQRKHSGTISAAKPSVGSAVSSNSGGLRWPPVNADFTIPSDDGYDVMPLTGLKVPKFWVPPAGANIFEMSDKVNGDETIFVMIASYRDFQCRDTIASAFLRADKPHRLFVGAVDQVVDGDIGCMTLDVPCEVNSDQPLCKYKDQISIYRMEAEMATGPVTARHIGDRLYRGEHYVMQLDAHCHFANHWDSNIIKQLLSTGNEMAVLSSYLSDVQGSLDANFDSTRNTRPIMCNSAFEGEMPARYLRHGSQPEDQPVIRDMPQLQPFWAAGFSFSRGHFKVQVPYDGYQAMVFQGEEITIGIRGFTFGYDFYAPRSSVVFHEYAVKSERRRTVHLYWENAPKHLGEGKKSLARSMSLIKMAPDIPDENWDHTDIERYGLGTVRTVDLFYKLFLINTKARSSEQLCPFVRLGGMHNEFQKFLRSDRMGIDYSKLANFDTDASLEKVLSAQRPSVESQLRNAISKRSAQGITQALEDAARVRLGKFNNELIQKARDTLAAINLGQK